MSNQIRKILGQPKSVLKLTNSKLIQSQFNLLQTQAQYHFNSVQKISNFNQNKFFASQAPLFYKNSKFFSSENNIPNENNENNKGSENENSTSSSNNINEGSGAGGSESGPVNNNNQSHSGSSAKAPKRQKLNAIPLKTIKLDIPEEELKNVTPKQYAIFCSQLPIIPYNKIEGIFKTGNLTKDKMSNRLAYFLQNNDGDVFQIGVVLDESVSKTVRQHITRDKGSDQKQNDVYFTNDKSKQQQNIGFSQQQQQQQQHQSQIKAQIVTKPKKFRVKIIEIDISDEGIVAKAIPYKDRKLSEKEKLINIQNELSMIEKFVVSIKRNVSYEKIEVFDDIDLSKINLTEINKYQIDELLYKVAAGIAKLSYYFKENPNLLIQTLLESRSYVKRVLLVRKKLEEMNSMLDIVNKNFRNADDQIMRLHAQAKARGAIDYIKNTYFGKDKDGGEGQEFMMGGGQNGGKSQVKKYNEKLHLIKDEPSKEKIRKEIERFSQLDRHASDFHKIQTYLDDVFSIPWEQYTPQFWDIEYTKNLLDSRIFGLEKVKQRIVEMIAVNKLKKAEDQGKGIILMLVGPPGTGKTSIAKAIADSLKRPHRFISFAGIADPYFMKGHRRTYVDSQPGVFIKELIKSQTMNPVLVLDEVDKLSRSHQGVDPYYSLLEILNTEENSNFVDHYLDIKVDFSKTIFILTANGALNMLEPLRNRLEIIEIPAYIEQEKLQIAQSYILPKVIEKTGLLPENIILNPQTIQKIIKGWCYYEGGVRELGRSLEKIARKYALEILDNYQRTQGGSDVAQGQSQDIIVESETKSEEHILPSGQQESEVIQNFNNQGQPSKLTAKEQYQLKENQGNSFFMTRDVLLNAKPLDFTQFKDELDVYDKLKQYLGPPIFDADLEERSNQTFLPGQINILTVSDYIGHVMTVETIFDPSNPDKKGQITFSGNIKNVLQESVTIAKINCFKYLNAEQIKAANEKSIHVHFMSAASPKDGPSAGISICVSLLSLILNIPVPASLAMTGELSLNGEVCKIGGVQAKLIAAKTININHVLVPYSNMGEVLDVSKLLLKDMTIYFIKDFNQIFDLLFSKEKSRNQEDLIVLKDGKFVNDKRRYTPFVSKSQDIVFNPIPMD